MANTPTSTPPLAKQAALSGATAEPAERQDFLPARGVLIAAAVATAALALDSFSAAGLALALAYLWAARNPWRYRIVINTALVFHSLGAVVAIYGLARGGGAHSALGLGAHFVLLLGFVAFYPSPYPVWMNAFGFFTRPDAAVDWMENHFQLFQWLSRGTKIGTVAGLYANQDAFNFVQDEGFLGFTTPARIFELAQEAGVRDGCRVLDLGSGLGGPACALGTAFRADVLGIDLLAQNVATANRAAAARFLDTRVRFEQGDALSPAVGDGTFDFVFGADAWCHIPERQKLLRECFRVLRPGGKMFFFDWIDTGSLSEVFRFVYAFPLLETFESYQDKLFAAGFRSERAGTDGQAAFAAHVESIQGRLLTQRARMIETCGREVYDNWEVVMQYTWRMITEGRLAHAFFVATKP